MAAVHPWDLQARAEAVTQCLTGLLDADRDGLLYFLGNWRARPPRAEHCLWDYGDGSGRHIDALALVRAMVPAGSPAAERDSGDQRLEGWMLRVLREDGLSWLPPGVEAEPWGANELLVDWQPGTPHVEISWAQRGTLLGLTTRFLQTGDEQYLDAGHRMVDGLLRIAERDEHGLLFPEGYYRPGGWHYHRANLSPGLEEYNAAVVPAAIRFFEASGYEPALELASGLVRGALYYTPGYLPDGSLRTTEGINENHFHTRSNFILGVLKLGILERRRELISWARQSYERIRSWGTDFGWFPEGFGMRHGEICCTTDMIELALLLGRHVDRAMYADAERFGRNQLLESQLLDEERLQAAVDRLPADETPPPHQGRFSTSDHVVHRHLGGFAARSSVNDAFHLDATSMMQCCTAAGARGIFDLWRYAVEAEQDERPAQKAVHLRFSVETPELRVVSHEPAEGRLDLIATAAGRIAVRLPAGATQAVAIRDRPGDAEPAHALWAQDGYVHVEAGAGEQISLHYALPEHVAHYTIGTPERSLCCIGYWRGETLMRIDPPGSYLPLYRRSSNITPAQPSLAAGTQLRSL